MSLTLTQGPLVLFLIKATIILVGALLATMAMQRASAGARHLVWLVTLGTLLLVPVLTAWGPIRLAILPAAAGVGGGSGEGQVGVRLVPGQSDFDAPATIGTPVGAQPDIKAVHPPATEPNAGAFSVRDVAARSAVAGGTVAIIVWALVALAIVAALLRDALVLRRIVRGSTPLDAPSSEHTWRDMLYEIADRLELPDAPRLLRSDVAKMPFACGVRRATIVLPAECDDWSLARRRAVLLHELAHVRRHDLPGHMLGRLACAVYWFHPLVWTAAKQLRAESERACDDLALGCGTQASDYAEHLLDIVTSVRRASTPTVALAMARRKEFEGRMLAILDPDVRRAAPKRRQAGALVMSLAAMAVLVGAATPARKPAQHVALAPTARPVAPIGDAASAQRGQDDTLHIADSMASSVASSVASDVENGTASAVAGDVAPHLGMSLGERVSRAVNRAVDGIQLRVHPELNMAAPFGTPVGNVSGPPSTRAALLIKVLQADTSARVRKTAAWGLAQLADVQGVADALAGALQHDPDPEVRATAAWGLAQAPHTSAAARDALMAAVQHDADAHVRSQSAWALGAIGNSAAIPALSAALHDTSESVRSNAAWAIGTVGPRTAPKAVVDALTDPSARVRANAAWALFTIGDRATAPALNAAFQHETNERVQVNVLEALGALGGDAAMPSVRAALNSSSARVKAAAVRALSFGGHGEGADPNPDPNPNPQ